MINTIEALQGLYVALGGDISDVANVTTIPEMLTLISTVAKAAASELPVVNTGDNGNVLTVVNGKWGKANVPKELPEVTGDDIGKVVSVISDGESGAEYALELPENELPTPAVGDIGKVVSVVSDGESGAEYSLETPASGGGEISRAISVNKSGTAALSVTFLSGAPTRDQIIASVNMADFKIDSSTISTFIWYNNADYSVMFGGDVFLTGVIQINNVYLPVYSGVILNTSGAGGTDTQGDLYQVIFILGATAADDRLEVIKLKTT